MLIHIFAFGFLVRSEMLIFINFCNFPKKFSCCFTIFNSSSYFIVSEAMLYSLGYLCHCVVLRFFSTCLVQEYFLCSICNIEFPWISLRRPTCLILLRSATSVTFFWILNASCFYCGSCFSVRLFVSIQFLHFL